MISQPGPLFFYLSELQFIHFAITEKNPQELNTKTGVSVDNDVIFTKAKYSFHNLCFPHRIRWHYNIELTQLWDFLHDGVGVMCPWALPGRDTTPCSIKRQVDIYSLLSFNTCLNNGSLWLRVPAPVPSPFQSLIFLCHLTTAYCYGHFLFLFVYFRRRFILESRFLRNGDE